MSMDPDFYITEVVIVLDELSDDQTTAVVKELELFGLLVDLVNHESSVIEGRVESTRAHELEQVTAVRYVRRVFTYAAKFPPGHPMDRNQR